MSLTTLVIPADYSYVLVTLLLTGVVNQYHGILTGTRRKRANIPYPNAYATHEAANASLDAYQFNCAQRAHANYLENLPQFVISTAIAGLSHPRITAGLAGMWLVGRVLYARGYVNGNQESKGSGRYQGMMYVLGQLGVMGLAAEKLYRMIM
ncbi:hypothetical protein EDC01DRAFT_261805 [Geopyxis carbonaria]|nr:hypothetical protein EDC01DRAFT_261805 [Geopyxis carbonaria]